MFQDSFSTYKENISFSILLLHICKFFSTFAPYYRNFDMYFDELALSDQVLDALWDMHFDTCTPVQEQTIPVILDGHDVISCAQTGTGKTAAYILPLLPNLEYDNHDPN